MRAKPIIWVLIMAFVLTGLAGCKPRQKDDNMNPQSAGSNSLAVTKNKPTCSECLAGLAVPLKDHQIIEDTNYPEVVTLDSSKWDSAKLPQKVIELQSKGYACAPAQSPKDADAKSAVKVVRWECQQIYHDYRNLQASEVDKKNSLEKQGFSCQKLSCVDERNEEHYIWFCSK